jgi:hypothetical protein
MRTTSDVMVVMLLRMNTRVIITYCRGGDAGDAALLKCFLHLAHLPLTSV